MVVFEELVELVVEVRLGVDPELVVVRELELDVGVDDVLLVMVLDPERVEEDPDPLGAVTLDEELEVGTLDEVAGASEVDADASPGVEEGSRGAELDVSAPAAA